MFVLLLLLLAPPMLHARPTAKDAQIRDGAAMALGATRAHLDAAVGVDSLIDPALSEVYSLLGAHASGVPPDLSIAAYARQIARAPRPEGHWVSFDGRPPHGAGLIAATALGARSAAGQLLLRPR